MHDENIFTYQISPLDGKIEKTKVETIEIPSVKTELTPGNIYCFRLAKL